MDAYTGAMESHPAAVEAHAGDVEVWSIVAHPVEGEAPSARIMEARPVMRRVTLS